MTTETETDLYLTIELKVANSSYEIVMFSSMDGGVHVRCKTSVSYKGPLNFSSRRAADGITGEVFDAAVERCKAHRLKQEEVRIAKGHSPCTEPMKAVEAVVVEVQLRSERTRVRVTTSEDGGFDYWHQSASSEHAEWHYAKFSIPLLLEYLDRVSV